VKGADILDGTPLLDIKPYIPEFDIIKVDKIGWYQNRKYR
jgi:tRNA (Thr-GGU) A37 N-methylase